MHADTLPADLVATKSGVLSLGSMLAVAVSHFFNLPTWIQVSAAVAATIASVYAIRLSRLNIKKTNAELQILRAKAAHLGITLDD